jgi:hypothetical protein
MVCVLWCVLALLCEVAYIVIIRIKIYTTCLSVPCCLCGAWLAVLWGGGRPIVWRVVPYCGLCWRAVHCSGLTVPFCGMVWCSVAWPGRSVAGLDVLGNI